ncbi:MAG TPA: hypothetical protein VHG91_01005 [Longimicrobium sp.]|nr:hypothetical protein [Longimicrobium sp.]
MTTQGIRYTAFAVVAAALVAAAGVRMGGEAYRDGVLWGAAIGFAVQVAAFWIFAVWLYPGRAWHGYGMGLVARMAAFGVAALLVVPRAGLPLAATLFSLVGVFWLTTVVEPVFLKTRTSNPTQG